MAKGTGGIITYQPFKALYILFSGVYELGRFATLATAYAFPSLRPLPTWTFKNAFSRLIFTTASQYIQTFGWTEEMDLSPGPRGERWVVVNPSPKSVYVDFLKSDKVKPGKIGGTWTPAPPTPEDAESGERVVLHFHGGGYAMGSPKNDSIDFAAENSSKHIGRTFSSNYRLASAGHAFPAALQDAVTAYAYLVNDLGYSASNIMVCGDSAGGNLALTLLRYLETFPAAGLPSPYAVLAWSPWVDLDATMQGKPHPANPLYGTDIVVLDLLRWSAPLFVGDRDPADPFISPVTKPFATTSRLFINAGELEVFSASISLFAARMAGVEGNVVRLEFETEAPHNTFLLGKSLGFEKSAEAQVKKARDFIEARNTKN